MTSRLIISIRRGKDVPVATAATKSGDEKDH
jgi:hypothetical protein